MSSPYGTPSAPPAKSRTPLYIALGCGCLLLALVVVVVIGGGIWFLQREPAERATDAPSATAQPTDEPTEPADPTDTTEAADPTSSAPSDSSVTLRVTDSGQSATLETKDGTREPEFGMFVGVEVELVNETGEEIGLDVDRFVLYDDIGLPYAPVYGEFTTSGPQIPAGETATARLYVDVLEDTVIESISYSDPVGTGGEEVEIPV